MTLTLPPSPQRPCLFDGLTEEHRTQVSDFVRTGVSTSRIVAALTTAGYSIGTDTVNRHRRGLCRACKWN